MQIDFQGTGLQAVRRPPGADWQRMMWINADRVLYLGLLGEPTVRCFGGFSVYLSLRGTHRICVDGGDWQDSAVSVVPPYVRHRIVSGERMICNLLVEAETVDLAALPPHLRVGRGAVDAPAALQRMREALDILGRADNRRYASTAAFDEAFFGAPLRTRALDARVLAVLDRIKSDPNGHVSAQECAAAAHLSVSRFLHLFKAETGSPFRSFRTWQRARSLLYYVTQSSNLTDIALDAGYPDSTHFSHSIRQVYGLTPKSIFAGSRKLALYASGAGVPRFSYH
ncbi:AraC family transcriptional regulator [Pseudorhodoferax sp. LjRoot39]|uniref:helix-turn-helix domain-containing protein n=1 Tax=Pseudorhodoferax sp. LjRoot39 TaxID=3342328 RepID=UPI003ED16AD6